MSLEMRYDLLKQLLEKKRINIPTLANEIGMSKAGMYQAIDKERLTVDTLEKIAKALSVPVSVFFESGVGDLTEEAQKLLESAKENYEILRKKYIDLEIKYENILKINSLNEKLVDSARKEAAVNEKLIFLIYVKLHGLQLYANDHIQASILLSHPELDAKNDSRLLNKYLSEDPFNKEFKSTMKLIEPVLKDDFTKYLEEENIFDLL